MKTVVGLDAVVFWVLLGRRKTGLLDFPLVGFLATSIFFKAKWENLIMLLSMRELIQY
jgi:hypothetical protein